MGKISGPCKTAAKKKFKVWPSAYASGWGVRCTKAGGPGKMGKKKNPTYAKKMKCARNKAMKKLDKK